MSRVLVATPARIGRFGHQTTTILTGIHIAHLTQSKLMLPRYMFFSDRWNDVTDWSRHKYIIDKLPESIGQEIKYLENRSRYNDPTNWRPEATKNAWKTEEADELGDMINKIQSIKNDSIIFLPFDQRSRYLLKLFNKQEFRNEFKKVFNLQRPDSLPKKPYICIHIRRGDVDEKNFPYWFVPNEFYIALIKTIVETIPDQIPITICTQGDISWLTNGIQESLGWEFIINRMKIFSTDQLTSNNSEIEHFSIMANSYFLFSANSAFSNYAGLLKKTSYQVDISKDNTMHYLKSVCNVNPDKEMSTQMKKIKRILQGVKWK